MTREYGPLGEVTKETRTTTGAGQPQPVTFTTQYQYDTWNRMLTHDLSRTGSADLPLRQRRPGRLGHRGQGRRSPTSYLTRLDYDKFEQRVLLDTGNGTRTQYTYNATDRRLHNLQANLASGYVFQNLNYTYDDVGNVTSIENDTVAPSGPDVGTQVGGPSTQTFSYDDLYQLVHAEGSYQPRTAADRPLQRST